MARIKALLAAVALTGTLAAQAAPEDPVLRARAERAQNPKANPGDLPPVPRTVMEPPPLPAPESHLKDARKAGKGRKAAAEAATTNAAHRSKKPAAKAKTAPKRAKKKR